MLSMFTPGVKELKKAFENTPELESLDLAGNGLSKQGCQDIMAWLASAEMSKIRYVLRFTAFLCVSLYSTKCSMQTALIKHTDISYEKHQTSLHASYEAFRRLVSSIQTSRTRHIHSQHIPTWNDSRDWLALYVYISTDQPS